MLTKIALVLLLAAAPAAAQVQSRPTDPPLVTAANEAWYQLREPIQFAGELYYPAGPAVFFDGDTMARVGHYNGVPLYHETTLEPFSVVLVPVRRGLMQPYERRRDRDLVGTTGSRTPSFPVRTATGVIGSTGIAQAASAPTQPQLPIGAISTFTPGASVAPENGARAIPTGGRDVSSGVNGPERQDAPMVSLLRPQSNDGVWIQFRGEKWVSAGPAVPLRAAEFRLVGQHAGFPVFIRTNEDDRIYLPTRAGLVAPYKLK